MKRLGLLLLLFPFSLRAQELKVSFVTDLKESSRIVINGQKVLCSCGRDAVDVLCRGQEVRAYCSLHLNEYEHQKELERIQLEMEEFDEALKDYLRSAPELELPKRESSE